MIMRRLLSCLLAALVTGGAWADAPAVSITYPTSGAVIDETMVPAILLQASVSDPDEAISSVSFSLVRQLVSYRCIDPDGYAIEIYWESPGAPLD
jgi:Big-like domain-containing protein